MYEKFHSHDNDTASAGYCGPSSILLLKTLQQKYPDEQFSLAVGRVYADESEWIRGKHVWIMWHQKLAGAIVVDVTGDQSKHVKNGKIVFGSIDALAKKGINYIIYQLTKNVQDVDESPKRRAELLESRLDADSVDYTV